MRFSIFLSIGLFLATLCGARAGSSYIIVDNETGHILGGNGANDKRQVASLTKMATAMVALDWAQLNKIDISQMATISPAAVSAGGSNPVTLQPGDAMSLRDLLYSALIASDNVAATALAEFVGSKLPNAQGLSPVNNFVTHMNALARTLEMKHTVFLNPSGVDNSDGPVPFSSAADMARLTRYAYSEADFPFYVAQRSRVVHIFRAGADIPLQLQNTNELLGRDNIDGVKTGRTSKAGDCVVLTAEHRPDVVHQGDTVLITPRRIIVVLLGSSDRFGEGQALLSQGWALYEKWAAAGRKGGSRL